MFGLFLCLVGNYLKHNQKNTESILPSSIPLRLAVEAGVAQGWERYVGDKGSVLSVENFGASAPGETVMQQYGFSVENVCKLELLKHY